MWKVLSAAGLALALAGCGITGPGPELGTERVVLSVAATGVRTIQKTSLGSIPFPAGNGELAVLLFDLYAGAFVERVTDLDHCRVATTSEPPDPDQVTGALALTATVICRLGPKKVRVREVVTMTLEPVAAS